ncbi:MAG TPA: type II toxin-antitoxin system VapC family toxin [Verrucomicrobiae bacterium]
MRYLLDTAPWANSVLIPEVIPKRVRQFLEGPETKGLCSVSLLECAIHHRLGRLQLSRDLPEFFEAGLASDIELIDLTPEIAVVTNELPETFHGDPFDRVIVATAKVLEATLITCDKAIRDVRFCKVEFYPFKPSRLK